MDLTTVFKLSLYGLTALVGWILGAAEQQSWLPFASLPFVIVGYVWCERPGPSGDTRQRGMSDTLASVLGFIALAFASNEFFGENPEGRLLAGTHLMVYLTWIVVLQYKTSYRCWLLLALGVLQVAVASVLTSGSWFGFCVVGYVFAAVWTLSVFSLYRAMEQFATAATQRGPDPLVRPDQGVRPTNGEPTDSTLRSGSTARHSQVVGSVQHADGGHWLSLRFVGGVALTFMTGLIVSTLFFALVPRVWVGTPTGFSNEDLPGLKRRSVSGFAADVRLGDMGTILESLDPVLEMRLIFPRTGNVMSPQVYAERLGTAEPLFRGAVLATYANNRWLPDNISDGGLQPIVPSLEATFVLQEIRLEPIGTEVLFCMGRPLKLTELRGKSSGYYRSLSGLAIRGPGFPKSGAVNYTVESELLAANLPEPIGLDVSRETLGRYLSTLYLRRNLTVPGGLERLQTLASQTVGEAQSRQQHELTELEIARVLESHFLEPGRYRYSLSMAIQDASIDPVEDFLFNRRAGHCEYFASALVMMLRSVGIPARLVTGFKGGVLSSDGTLHIQQRFAHAWVEALIDRKTWVTLDGTPAAERTASVAEVATRRSVWTDVRARVSGLWSENIVNISFDRQEELIYRPSREIAALFWETVLELWASPRASLESFLHLVTNPQNWWSFGGAATLWGLGACAWFFRRRLSRLRLSWRDWKHSPLPASRRWIEFYERFVRLMQSRGLQRAATQTQHEFATLAAETLVLELREARLHEVPRAVSEVFYRVRFGDETLSDAEATQIEALLSRLEHALAPANHRESASQLNGQHSVARRTR